MSARQPMTKVVSIAELRKARQRERARSSLCREGHHKWQVVKERQFDVKRGKLVTLYRCQRCGAERVTAH